MPKKQRTETKMVLDIFDVMTNNKGPFTKTMLIEKLSPIYTELSYQELKNKISAAIIIDKQCHKRFKSVRVNVWDLKEKIR